jgi:hypothetical protein
MYQKSRGSKNSRKTFCSPAFFLYILSVGRFLIRWAQKIYRVVKLPWLQHSLYAKLFHSVYLPSLNYPGAGHNS